MAPVVAAVAKVAAAAVVAVTTPWVPKDVELGKLKEEVTGAQVFKVKVSEQCEGAGNLDDCTGRVTDKFFCQLLKRSKYANHPEFALHCPAGTAAATPTVSIIKPKEFLQAKAEVHVQKAPEDELAKEMTHDLEMNFNKIAPFGKEDTAKELQDHAAKTQDTLVDAVENAEVAEIKRAVFRALTRLRAATIKEFDTIARLETQAIDAYNDAHHYRAENPLAHLHEDEAPVETDKLKSFH